MEKKIIRRESDLPDWYKRKKYKGMELLSCLGWYWQLAARVELWNFVTWEIPEDCFDKHPDNHSAQTAKSHQKASKALLERIREQPILDESCSYESRKYFGEILPYPDSGIRPASLSDIDQQLIYLRHDERGTALDYLCKKNESLGIELTAHPISNMQRETLDEVLLNVRLDIPERLLIDNFTAFVRSAKAARLTADKEDVRYRMPDFSLWSRIGILPYLDLKIWEMQEDVSIPNRVMAEAIFTRDDISGEETVRKTTEKLAYQILEEGLLKELAVLHATEQLQNQES